MYVEKIPKQLDQLKNVRSEEWERDYYKKQIFLYVYISMCSTRERHNTIDDYKLFYIKNPLYK